MQELQERYFRDPTLSSHVWWGCLPRYLTKRPSSDVADCDRVTANTTGCTTTYFSWGSGILEQRVSGTMDTTRWTDSMACSFPRFKSVIFLFISGDI